MSAMTLSEAIRLGAMMKPQGFGGSYSTRLADGTACAMDAAILAVGIEANEDEFKRVFGCLAWEPACCPVCAGEGSVGSITTHLNDSHCWTREQIADWLEAIENQVAVQSPAETTTAQTLRTPEPSTERTSNRGESIEK